LWTICIKRRDKCGGSLTRNILAYHNIGSTHPRVITQYRQSKIFPEVIDINKECGAYFNKVIPLRSQWASLP
jgi:hypothetical protein